MKKVLALVFISVLLFGCINFGEEQKPTPTQNNTTVVIKIEPQKNTSTITPGEGINESQEENLPPYTYDPNENLGMYFIDACEYETGAQGSAILIKKGDFDMLIDAGGKESGKRVVEFLKARGVDDIEVLVSSAEDKGKYGGLEKVAEEFSVDEFWWNGQATTQDYKNVVDAVQQKAKKTVVLSTGYERELDGIKIEVINPPKKTSDVYNDAVVLLVSDRKLKALLLSNAHAGAQGYIVNNHKEKMKNLTIMTAPEYGLGSGTATIGVFLQSIKPEETIIEGCAESQKPGTREPFIRLLDLYKMHYWKIYEQGDIRAIVKTVEGENASEVSIMPI